MIGANIAKLTRVSAGNAVKIGDSGAAVTGYETSTGHLKLSGKARR
jgi:hypothetical protein